MKTDLPILSWEFSGRIRPLLKFKVTWIVKIVMRFLIRVRIEESWQELPIMSPVTLLLSCHIYSHSRFRVLNLLTNVNSAMVLLRLSKLSCFRNSDLMFAF